MTPDDDAHPADDPELDGIDALLRGAFGEAGAAPAPGADVDEPLATIVLPERYHVLGEVGRGGVGIVLEAEDRTLRRRIAVKVLQARHRHSSVLRSKFDAESVIGAQLQHPGILGVLDVGRTADDRPFFTTRLVPGDNLSTRLRLREAGAPHLATWLPVFARICEAIAYAHARGVVHRDLKPGNVLIGAFGEVLVTDWGMAKLVGSEVGTDSGSPETPVTTAADGRSVRSITGSLWGTPAYMAPEQARGEADAASPRADVFGLGALLCEILTGEPPYLGVPELVLVQARLGDLAEATARLRAAPAPPDLVALALRCLHADPAQRPDDAAQVAEAIQQHLASAQERAQQASLAAAAAEARAAADRRTHRVQAAWFGTVAVALVGAFLLWYQGQRGAEERQQRGEQRVEAAVAEGEARWREAVARGPSAEWRAVAESAAAAGALAGSPDLPPHVQDRARRFAAAARDAVSEAAERVTQAAADAALRTRLAALHGREWLDGNLRAREAGYAALFAELGMDPTAGDAAAAARAVRAHRLAEDLAIALDRWASCCVRTTHPPERTAAIRTAATLADDDPVRRRLRELLERPDRDEVLRMLRATPLPAVPPATVFLLQAAAQAAGDADLAFEILERGHLAHPTDLPLVALLAQTCAARGDVAGETRYADAAMALAPDAIAPVTRLAGNLAQAGKVRQAEGLFHRLVERHPDDPGLLHNLGAAQQQQGHIDEAIATLQRVEAAGAGNDRTALVLGKCYRKQRQFDLARRWFAVAAERLPTNCDPWVSLGAMLCDDLRDYPAALAAFDRALAIAPRADDAMRNRGLVLQFLGRKDDAYAHWQAAADMFPAVGWAHEQMARLDYAARRLDAAVANASEAIRRDAKAADAWYLLGTVLGDLDEPKAAVAALRCAVRVKPDHGPAWHDLGWALADHADTRAEAIAAFRQSITFLPDVAMSHYNLARALHADGQIEACRLELAAALRLQPDLALARELLATLPAR